MQVKTYSQLVAELLTAIGSRTPLTNFNVGSVIRTLTEVVAEVVGELYAFGADMLRQGFLDTATGTWLERKAAEYAVTRNPAVKTQGRVVFSRNVARNTNVPIPAGTIVATPKDQAGVEYRFFTTAAAVLPANQLSVEVLVDAETAGQAWNVGSGAISKMKTYIAGVDAVNNATGWLDVVGADAENDTSLRQRCYLAWEELSQGGTAAAYISWALSVPGVRSAYVDDDLPRGDGTLDLYIIGEAGPPDAALLDAVQAVVDANRPITADALVRPPDVVTVPIALRVTPRAGYDVVAMEAEIRRRLSVLFGDVEDASLAIRPLGVGKDVVVAQIVAAVMGVTGLYRVVVEQPAADVDIAANEFPELGAVTVTMEAPTNE
jgi:uncharacterized phage protein gp47/JayE